MDKMHFQMKEKFILTFSNVRAKAQVLTGGAVSL
jgi:hypothetical protein